MILSLILALFKGGGFWLPRQGHLPHLQNCQVCHVADKNLEDEEDSDDSEVEVDEAMSPDNKIAQNIRVKWVHEEMRDTRGRKAG